MREDQLGRLLRMLRLRKNWTQEELSARARISRSTVCRIEGGQARRYRVEVIQRHAAALEVRVELIALGRGGELPRLADEEHAAIVEWVARLLTDDGWEVVAEPSFAAGGERGWIDLLAFHPEAGTLLIVEVKTEITDLQALFGSLSIKERRAPSLALERGWQVTQVSTLLAVADMPANRRHISQHRTLFGRFVSHASSVRRRLRSPRGPDQLLLYVDAAEAMHGRRSGWLATRRRVRKPKRT